MQVAGAVKNERDAERAKMIADMKKIIFKAIFLNKTFVVMIGCEWGDEASWCRNIKSERCYHEGDRGKCCATCRSRETGIPGISNLLLYTFIRDVLRIEEALSMC